MRKSKFTPEQIAYSLRRADQGTPCADVCRQLGISMQTFYRWKKAYGDLEPSEVKRLRITEDENRRLKQLVAELSLDKQILQDALAKKL